MRNRAKCKLCGETLESFHIHDYVTCKCGEIAIDGGSQRFSASAKDYKNFLRVDDEGNEIVVTVKDKEGMDELPVVIEDAFSAPLTKKELLGELEAMMKGIDSLPENAKTLPINHYDLYSALLIIKSLFEVKE